jgi:hypothetical protein
MDVPLTFNTLPHTAINLCSAYKHEEFHLLEY